MSVRQKFPVSSQIYFLPILAAAGFLIVSLLEFTVQSYRADIDQKNAQNVLLINKIRSIQRQITTMRISEKEFLKNPGLTLEHRQVEATTILVNELKGLEDSLGTLSTTDWIPTVNTYRQQFGDAAKELKIIGLSEFEGLRGQFRSEIHSVEGIINSRDPTLMRDMLELRRHEKDFIIRKDPKYLNAWQRSIGTFRTTVKTSDLSASDKAKVLAKLDSYVTKFLVLVKHRSDLQSDEIHLNTLSAGIQNRINIAYTKTLIQLKSSLEFGQVLSQRAGIFVEIAIFLTGVSIFLFSKWIGTGIAVPLRMLNSAMKKLAKGDLNVRIPATDYKNELGAMATAVRTFRENEKSRRVEHLELGRLNAKTRNILRSINEAIFEMDINGNVKSLNDAAQILVGGPQAELVGRNLNECIFATADPHGGMESGRLLATIMAATEQHRSFDATIRTERGDIPIACSATWLRDEADKIIGSLCMIRDVSNRKKAEEKILQFKRSLDQTADEVYMFWPGSYRLFYLNKTACNLTGWSIKGLGNKTVMDFNPSFDCAAFEEMVTPLVAGEVNQVIYERKEYRTGRDVEVTIEHVTPETGTPPYFVSFVRDITERKVADTAKREFISTVSHELRTPLTSIKGSLGIIQAGAVGDLNDKAAQLVSVALKNTNRLVKLINDILDIEKIAAGKMEFHLETVDLSRLMGEAISANTGYVQALGVKLRGEGLEQSVKVKGDADRLMQVMANLISNAAKFSNRGASVVVSLALKGHRVRVSVRDTGAGIPKEAQAKLFDKFTQVDSSDRRAKGGTGLGLNLVKAMVKAHGGAIALDSEVGKGTTFYFELALVTDEEALLDEPIALGLHAVK